MYKNLREYVNALEKAGELLRIGEFADPVLEIGEITDRMSKSPGGGKALLFENTGTGFPVLTNMMGSERRICMALGVARLDEVSERIERLFAQATSPKHGLMQKLALLPTLAEASAWLPRRRNGRGECQQVVLKGAAADISKLPVLKCWPFDGGRFVTLPLVHTADAVTGVRNVGMYRMQVFDAGTTGMHWHRHKTGERHYEQYRGAGRRMPVAVCLGGDPVCTYAATAPLPDGIDEYLLAGFLRRKPVELVRCVTNDLEVPSDCDFVIEGYVDPAEDKVPEGDFGDHTGFYSLKDLYPRFHITCITHRRDAIYPATIVGIPTQEDAWIAHATERIFMAPIRLAVVPEMRDLWMPKEGAAHNIAVCTIEKIYPGQAFKVANAMWGAGQMMFNKMICVMDAPAEGEAGGMPGKLGELLRSFDPRRDVLFSRGTLDVLDHAAPTQGFGGKICIDLTRKLPEEEERSEVETSIPRNVVLPDGVTGWKVPEGWPVLFLFCADQFGEASQTPPEEIAKRFSEANAFSGIKAVVLFDGAVSPDTDVATLVWLAGGNTDAERDMSVSEIGPDRRILLADARAKISERRPWPNIVAMSPEIVAAVDAKWESLGLGGFIASPSEKFRPLVISGGAQVSRK